MMELFYDKFDGEFLVVLFRKSLCTVHAWEMMAIQDKEFSPCLNPDDLLKLYDFVGDFSSFDELKEFFLNKYPELMI